MIKSGRNTQKTQPKGGTDFTRTAKLTALFGAVVFAVFLCSSLTRDDTAANVSTDFGEGAYQVFAPVDGPAHEEASTVEDGSIWAYLESAIARLIYGER